MRDAAFQIVASRMHARASRPARSGAASIEWQQERPYPFDMAEPDPVGFLGRVKGVSEKDMALVAGGTAERLLGLSPKTTAKA
jgi:hypothetical protein